MHGPSQNKPVHTLYHVKHCEKFIKNRVSPTNKENVKIELVGSFKSYMTGLKYHKYVEKPSKDRIYLCLPNPNNKFDANALGVYANQTRIAFVPRDLCAHVAENFEVNDPTTAVLCYCTGKTTETSSQCVYNVFRVRSNTNHQMDESEEGGEQDMDEGSD